MTELAKPTPTQGIVPSMVNTDRAIKEEQPEYLPNIQIKSPNADDVKDGTFKAGDIAVRDNNLGTQTVIVVCHQRWHALLIENGKRTQESYDVDSPISAFLKSEDNARKRSWPDYDIRRGLEFLCYVPACDTFALFHPNTWSARNTGSSTKIKKCIEPMETRSEAGKQLPYTNYFTLSSRTMTNVHKTPIPHIEPCEPDASMAPKPEELAKATKQFEEPVRAEASISETDDTVLR